MKVNYIINKLFGIIILFVWAFLLVDCTPQKWTTIGNGDKMKIEYNHESFSKEQIDSICVIDSLSPNLKKDWVYLPIIDEETNEAIEKFMYIKKLDSLETFYIIEKYVNKDTYKVTKRITYN